jgi:hypothetical protein
MAVQAWDRASARRTVTASRAEEKGAGSNSQQLFSGKLAATSRASCKVIEPEFRLAVTSVLAHQAFSAPNRIHQLRQLRRSEGRSVADVEDVSWSPISARRFTAFSRRAAASRAIAGSPLSPARGRLRSNAVMSSRSLRARSLRLSIAT